MHKFHCVAIGNPFNFDGGLMGFWGGGVGTATQDGTNKDVTAIAP